LIFFAVKWNLREIVSLLCMAVPLFDRWDGTNSEARVTDRPKGARDDQANGATKSGSFSLLDGVHYSSFFALFSFVVFVPWGQFFGER
jgi:hypothetical protein